MSEYQSAIDDSFDPTPLTEQASEGGNALDNAYSGPRDGRWEVASNTGSYIDDRSPTVYASRPRAARSGKPVDEGLTRKLLQANAEKHRAAVARAPDRGPEEAAIPAKQSTATQQKPFVVPKSLYKPAEPTTSKVAPRQEQPKPQAQPKAPSPKIPKTTAPMQQEQPAVSSIKVRGRNGEEVIINLPRPLSTSGHPQPDAEAQPAKAGKQKQKQKQQTKERSPKNRTPEPQATLAAPPTPSNRPSHSPRLDDSSCKDSGIGGMAGMFDTTSRAASKRNSEDRGSPVTSQEIFEIAQSIAKLPSTASSKAGSAPGPSVSPKHRSVSSQDILKVAQKIASMPSRGDSRVASIAKSPTPPMFEPVGEGVTTGFPAQRRESEHGYGARKRQSNFGQASRPASKGRAPANIPQDHGSVQGTLLSNYQPPTVQSGSDSSVTHSFGGFGQGGGFEPQPEAHHHHKPPSAQKSARSSHNHDQRWSPQTGNQQPEGSDLNRAKTASVPAASIELASTLRLENMSDPISTRRSHRSGGGSGRINAPVSPPQLSPLTPRRNRERTKFAGDGWISPHPLSVAPSDIGLPPQSAVYFSTGGQGQCGKLSYSDWRAQRDEVRSIAGSFSGASIPSADGSHLYPPDAYAHPPPTGFGSFHPAVSKTEEETIRDDWLYDERQPSLRAVQQPWAPEGSAIYQPAYGQEEQDPFVGEASAHGEDRQASLRSRGWGSAQGHDRRQISVHSRVSDHYEANESRHHSHHSQMGRANQESPAHQTPSVLAQDAGLDLPPQYDGGFRSGVSPTYNVGMTPTELSNYQRQLGSTVSRYSRIARSEQEQATSSRVVGFSPAELAGSQRRLEDTASRYGSRSSSVPQDRVTPQPDYSTWDRDQGHGSARSSMRQQVFPSISNHHHEVTQIVMPWDRATNQTHGHSANSQQLPAQEDVIQDDRYDVSLQSGDSVASHGYVHSLHSQPHHFQPGSLQGGQQSAIFQGDNDITTRVSSPTHSRQSFAWTNFSPDGYRGASLRRGASLADSLSAHSRLSHPDTNSLRSLGYRPSTMHEESIVGEGLNSPHQFQQFHSREGSLRGLEHVAASERDGSEAHGSRVVSNGSDASAASRSTYRSRRSGGTYGTTEWQNLENAEQGQGGFQSRLNYRER